MFGPRAIAIVVGSLVLLVAGILWITWAIVSVPDADVALRKSLEAINRPALTTAITLHPDYCSITGAPVLGWYVECTGVPMHHYTETAICNPAQPGHCEAAPAFWTDCVSFWWEIDMWGQPSDPNGITGKLASMGDHCLEKATLAEDRAQMNQRGLLLTKTRVIDYTGRWAPNP